ncbi:MAG: hypothetical protein OEV59_07885 [Deltaproteobacteria bacterium]|nr:hypothetical protein [Deltaproteobacteria bacterium]
MKAFLYRNRYRFLWIIPVVLVVFIFFPGKREFKYYATGVQFEQKEKHLKYRDELRAWKKTEEKEFFFGLQYGHALKRGGDAVVTLWHLDAMRTYDSHDNRYEKISIEAPVELVENGGEVDLASNRRVLVFYGRGVFNGRHCFGYPEDGILKVSKVDSGQVSVYLKFKVKLYSEQRGFGYCDEREVEETAVLEYRENEFK